MSNYQQYAVDSGGMVLPETYTSQLLAVSMRSETHQDTWRKAGYLQAVIRINGVNFSGDWFPIVYGYQLIKVPYTRYRLRYRPASLHRNHLQIRPLSKSQINRIMPLYNTGTTVAEQPVLDSVPTSFTAPAFAANVPAPSFLALPANPARQSYAIANIGAAIVNLDLDPPTALNKRLVSIPPGSTWVSDIPYIGNVYIWSNTQAPNAIEVREFIQ